MDVHGATAVSIALPSADPYAKLRAQVVAQSQQGGSQGGNQYGEGNYAASRDYNERTKQFVESGRVEEAARKAAPGSDKEAREMSEAEREGRRPMREEDPAINPDKGSKKPGQGPDTRQ